MANNRELQVSLFHLHTMVKDIGTIINTLVQEPTLTEGLFIPIHKYLIIRTCAFYDEFEHHFLKYSKSNDNRFNKLEKIYEFVKNKRNTYFPDLYNIRNYALAHNYRVKIGSKYHSIFESQVHFTFPKTPAEISINIHLMDNFLSAIKCLYPDIHSIMEENLLMPTENSSLTLITEDNCLTIIAEISGEIQRIYNE